MPFFVLRSLLDGVDVLLRSHDPLLRSVIRGTIDFYVLLSVATLHSRMTLAK
jgi:hypothetical protein